MRGRIIRHWINCKGYKVVALSKDGVVKNKAVHKLVCDVFHDNPNNYPCVNHKNGIKTDCAETNLEHASYSQNNQHAFDTGLKKPTGNNGEDIGTHKVTGSQVLEIRELASRGTNGLEIAKRFGIHNATACRIITRKTWRHL